MLVLKLMESSRFTSPILSFCTTCMGRVGDIQITMAKNLEVIAKWPMVNWVLLDYNSADGLADYTRRELRKYIDGGRLTYLRTDEPQFYQMGHSRNVAFLAAEGSFVYNVDADNIITKDFVSMMVGQVNSHRSGDFYAMRRRSFRGRLGLCKEDFIGLGGYDEALKGYGYDDRDLMERALARGFRLRTWGLRSVIRPPVSRLEQPKAEKGANLEVRDVSVTEVANRRQSVKNVEEGRLVANEGQGWGRARLVRNFSDELVTGVGFAS